MNNKQADPDTLRIVAYIQENKPNGSWGDMFSEMLLEAKKDTHLGQRAIKFIEENKPWTKRDFPYIYSMFENGTTTDLYNNNSYRIYLNRFNASI